MSGALAIMDRPVEASYAPSPGRSARTLEERIAAKLERQKVPQAHPRIPSADGSLLLTTQEQQALDVLDAL